MDLRSALALVIILLTYVGVALGELRPLRMTRATIALVGAVLLVASGALTFREAADSLDADTLVLLFGMMVLNVHLRLAGFFNFVAALAVRHAASPRLLLAWIIAAAGILSALFLNDTVVLMFTPLVLQVVLRLRRNPIPYLMGLATAANVGSAATITGNPQNMLIGLSSGLSYAQFSGALAPMAAVGLAVCWAIIVAAYRSEFASGRFEERVELTTNVYSPLFHKSLLLTGAMLLAFLAGAPMAIASLAVAAALLVTRRIKPARIFAQVDWSLLVFFSGLFVTTGAIERLGFARELFRMAEPVARGGVVPFALATAALSNVVSNVPAVLLFRPLVPDFPDPPRAWLTLAMASTLAGNLTLLGSVANLIVAESARAAGVRLTFGEYLRAGVPITLVTLAIGALWLAAR